MFSKNQIKTNFFFQPPPPPPSRGEGMTARGGGASDIPIKQLLKKNMNIANMNVSTITFVQNI